MNELRACQNNAPIPFHNIMCNSFWRKKNENNDYVLLLFGLPTRSLSDKEKQRKRGRSTTIKCTLQTWWLNSQITWTPYNTKFIGLFVPFWVVNMLLDLNLNCRMCRVFLETFNQNRFWCALKIDLLMRVARTLFQRCNRNYLSKCPCR